MDGNIVKLVFQTIAAGSGFAQVSAQTSELQKKLGKLSQGVQVLGQCFGNLGGIVGRGIGMLLQGGIWGAAASGIQLLIEKTGLFKKNIEQTNAAIKTQAAYLESARKNYESSLASITKETEQKKRQIEITKAQTKAEYDLAIAKEKASGHSEKAVKLAEEAAKAATKSEQATKKLTVAEAEAKLAAAKKAASGLHGWKNGEFEFDKEYWNKQYRSANGVIGTVRMAKEQKHEDEMHWKRTVAQDLYKPGEDLDKRMKEAREAKAAIVERTKAAKKAAEDIAAAKQALAEAKQLEATEKTASAASVIVAKTAAKDEAVRKLREDLTANEAKKKIAAQPLGKGAAGGTFSEHFDLWRDPAAAQQAQDAAKAKDEDLKKFRKSVDRYGGKWRIDEAAALMRDGDDEGLQSKLREWRKSSKFNGQTEQMVLAEAARQNEHAADKALAEISKTSADINAKLETIKAAFERSAE